jgi:hypothetical protein
MKKIIVTLLSVATLATTLSTPLVAKAGGFEFDDRDDRIGFWDRRSDIYKVMYRRRYGDWKVYGKYDSRFQAEKVAFFLERQGYRTYVERR